MTSVDTLAVGFSRYLFSFNPKKRDLDSFINNVLKTVLGEAKLLDLNKKQKDIELHNEKKIV